jgi:hypothetical protein
MSSEQHVRSSGKIMKKPDKKRIQEVVKQLREKATGTYVWRVRDKDRHSYCIEFPDHEKSQAEDWWEKNRTKYPDYHKNNELARVFFHTADDRLMLQAAEYLEALAEK